MRWGLPRGAAIFSLTQITIVAMAFTILQSAGVPDQPDDPIFGRMERAVVTGDKPTLLDCRNTLQQSVSQEGKNASATLRYALAYVDWRLDQLRKKKEHDPGFLKEAQENLHIVVSADPSNGEAQALLGSVLGQRIGRNGSLGMFLGPRSQGALDRAQKDAPDSPRVALQRGVSDFLTPAMFGGSLDKAEKELRRALSLFGKQPANQPWPNWGQLDAFAWLGQVLKKKGDLEGARNAYNQALALEADYRFVRDVLLPALDRAVANKEGN